MFPPAIFADPQERGRSLVRIGELVEHYQGFSAAREKAEELIDQALAALPLLDDPGARQERAVLQELCTYVLNRDK